MNRNRFERLKRILQNFYVDLDTHSITNLKTLKQKKMRLDSNGYYQITFSENNKSYGYAVHEIMAFKAFGEQIIGCQINHLDGTKTNNHPSNLEPTDAFGNMKHAYDMGLLDKTGVFKKGAAHPFTRLTNDDVIEMRRLYVKTKLHTKHIAEKFRISQSLANEIITGRHWAHVPDYLDEDFKALKKEKYKIWTTKGEERTAAKIKEEDVLAIRLLYRDTDITMKELGIKYGIKDNTISSILTGDTWGHVPFPLDWCYEEIRLKKQKINRNKALNNKHGAKLTLDEVNKIRELYETGLYTQKQLRHMFNISSGRISEIVNYKTWTD
jgi:hypothetical protein